jgi:hypothetical protein
MGFQPFRGRLEALEMEQKPKEVHSFYRIQQ